MQINDVLALVRAGFTRDEIRAMENPSQAEQNPQPAPTALETQPAPEAQPAPTVPETQATTADQIPGWATVLVQQLQQQQRQLEQMSVRSTGQPQGVMLTPEEYAQQSLRSLAGMPADDNK